MGRNKRESRFSFATHSHAISFAMPFTEQNLYNFFCSPQLGNMVATYIREFR